MTVYLHRISDFGQYTANIITLSTYEAAERGENYLNPDDYMFLCEAESYDEANAYWVRMMSEYYTDIAGEYMHP